MPDDALLRTYRGGVHPERWGGYGDCFAVSVDRAVTLAEFVVAFYSSPLFRIERLLLRVLAGAPSSDADVRALADGSATVFSLWYVGTRTATQLLMCDRHERTRSWFRVVPLEAGKTRLQFGTALAAAAPHRSAGARPIRSALRRLLMGFHVLYSRALLRAARSALVKK